MTKQIIPALITVSNDAAQRYEAVYAWYNYDEGESDTTSWMEIQESITFSY
jgi:hypothetical protein